MTVEQARERLAAGGRVRMTVEQGHVLHLWLEGGCVMSACVEGWCAGVVEPVCASDSDFLLSYLAGRELEAAEPLPAWEGAR